MCNFFVKVSSGLAFIANPGTLSLLAIYFFASPSQKASTLRFIYFVLTTIRYNKNRICFYHNYPITLITLQNIKKDFGIKEILRDGSFSIEENDKVGLIGVNGSGKSTLLKAIACIETFDSGSVTVRSKKLKTMNTISIPKGFRVTPEQFDQLANYEQEVRLELTASGELIIMSPTGGTAGIKNFRLIQQLANWIDQNKTGIGFDCSTVFILPNGARKSPDVSWIKLDRWNKLTQEQQDGFPPITPDFVMELVSPSDLTNQRYQDLQNKMQEYIDNGVKLGWLIEPKNKTVEIYRKDQLPELLDNPQSLSGEYLLPGFILDLTNIFA